MNIPLINIQDVVDFADLDPNIQQRKFNQYIIMAQDRFLSGVIGVDCLTGLVDRTCDNTLTTDDVNLLDLIKPYLVNYSYGLYVGSSMKLSMNSGVSTLTGDNATVIGQQSRVNESKKYILLGEKQAEKIVQFLIDNPTLYPCYDDELCKIKTTYSPYFGL
jgi:hypothetical protein